MELVEIRLCFKPNRFNGSDLLKLLEIENFLGFSPTRFSSGSLNNNNYRISYDSKNLDRLKNVKNRLKITVETDSDFGAQFHLFDAGKSFGGQILYWIVPFEIFQNLNYEFLLEDPSFVCGYCFDHDYVNSESTTDIGTNKMYSEDIKNLKMIKDEFGRDVIDISNNPGRAVLLPNIWLQTAWRMYFGKVFYEFVTKERLLEFSKANNIQELTNDVLFIELFEHVFESNSPKNKSIQKKFREWVDMDGLEKSIKLKYDQIQENLINEDISKKKSTKLLDSDHIIFDDIKQQSNWIVECFNADGLVLNYSIRSFIEIDKFFLLHSKNGKALEKGRLAKNLDTILFSIGSYIGATFIKNIPGSKWEINIEDSNNKLDIAFCMQDGTICWPMARVMKRFTNGIQDGIYPYGFELTKKYLNEEFDSSYWEMAKILAKKKPFWKFW